MKRKHKVFEQGHIAIFAKHKVLKELARLLEFTSESSHRGRSLNIFVGAHEWIYDYLPYKDINIGIQTEQLFDSNGKRLWGMFSDRSINLMKLKFDLLIDLSFANARIYQSSDLKFLELGPYIFPSTLKSYSGVPNGPVFFVGSMNSRRAAVLQKYSGYYTVCSSPKNTFGKELDRQVALSSSVLNIHFDEGVYTEYPRLLFAYMNGKPVISEKLDYPMVANHNYLLIGTALDSGSLEKIFDIFSKDIAEKFKLDTILKKEIHKRTYSILVLVTMLFAAVLYKSQRLILRLKKITTRF